MTTQYSQSPWNLKDLFPSHDGPEVQEAFADLEKMVSEIEAYRPQLSDNIPSSTFMDIIHRMEKATDLAVRLNAYAFMFFSGDTQNQTAQTFMGKVDQFTALIQNRVLFFSLWWKDLDDNAANRLMENTGDYRYWLEAMRLFKPHTLTEPEEKIINIKDVTGNKAISNFYDTITNRYLFKLTVDGEEKELTRDALAVYARHHDPEVRAAVYQELYRVYSQDGLILGQMYQSLARDWHNEQVDLRHYPQPISARNLSNDVPDEAVDILLSVCEQNAPLFQRYFQLKAKWLGVPKLRRYDLYAPVAKSDKTYDFNTAVEMVFEAFNGFHPKVAQLAERVLEYQHLDSEVRHGKYGGAYCYSASPGLTPWVLVNFQGKADDVATLAHELGHAIHGMMAEAHTAFTFHSTLPLAETASTFSEMLLVDYLLAKESDDAVRRDILFRQMDDSYATIMRQAYFALFEKQAHEMIFKDASVDELSAAYLDNLARQFGQSMELSDEFKWEWVSIPHIYRTPFYVYAYTFGQLLVLSLYKQYKSEGESFKPRYLKILAAGGSAAPANILAEAGIDINKAEFWQGGFDVLDLMLKDLEAIPIAK
ncbi:MAG: M3 family oligoendopeptidase [Anaerolineales bacterium]|nr:M3 family oligoendopeptidase [Anaerolineales bacterium]